MSTEGEIEVFYNFVLQLTKQAGKVISDKLKEAKTVEVKACNVDLVTETDKEVENLLINGLRSEFPDHKFIGEESVAAGVKCQLTEAPTWIIDPIDGTMNFVHSFPHPCISIALLVDFEPVIGIVYNPILSQLFTAKKNQGAFLNGERINVSDCKDLSSALLMLENGTSRDPEKIKVVCENQQKLVPLIHGTRQLGSAALDIAMVALGCADAYFEFGIHIWDFAAGELLVREAGGVVMDPSGGPIDRLSRRFLCASSLPLAEALSRTITQYHPLPRD